MSEKSKKVSLPWFGIPKIMPYLKPYRRTIIAMMIMGCLTSLIDSVYPLFNRYALDHFVAEGTMDTLPLFVISYLVILAAQVVMNYISISQCGAIEMYVDRDLRNASFSHLQEFSLI